MTDKILKYMSDSMTARERSQFEEELKNSPQLRAEYERQLYFSGQIREMSEIKLNEAYLNTIVPRVREKLEVKPSGLRFFRLAYVLPVTAVIAMIIFLPFILRQDNSSEMNLLSEDFSVTLGLETLQEMYPVNSAGSIEEEISSVPEAEEIADNAVLNELSSGNSDLLESGITALQTGTLQNGTLDTGELTRSMTDDEAEEIYKSLINKKIL